MPGPSLVEPGKRVQAYEGLMFREALKAGWYDLLLARDAYRVAVGEHGLHRDMVARFLEVPPQC